MEITYLGHSCFCIESKSGVKLITDPYTRVGYELPNGLTADIVLVSHGHFDHSYVEAISGKPMVISTADTLDVKGVTIKGCDTWHDPKQGTLRGKNVIFQFIVDGITFCHFGDLGEMDFEKVSQAAANADVWLIPIGGTYTIDAQQAKAYMDMLSPKLVIPMHYRPQDGKLDIAEIESFLRFFDYVRILECPHGKYSFTKEDLDGLSGKIIYMERSKYHGE